MRPGAGRGEPSAPRCRIVFICTANRARSPFAAALLRRRLKGLQLDIESFGTIEQGGAAALPSAVRAARDFGVDLTVHRARPLLPGALAGAQLTIGFELFHVASAVLVGGASRPRTFLLTELADALEAPDVPKNPTRAGLDALVGFADAQRNARVELPRTLADPVGSSDRRFLELYHEIDRLVAIIAARVFGAVGERTG